jgi:type I restriction enzyme, S subunit
MNDLTLPSDWTIQTLGAVCAKPEYGLTETATTDRVGPRFLRITDIQGGEVAWDKVPFCRCSRADVERHRVQPGDLLVARIGGTTGKTFFVRNCPEEAVFASYLIRLRPNAVHDRYLYYFCQSRLYWEHINAGKDERLKGGVNSSSLTQLPIVVPPQAEQVAIADVLEGIESAARNQTAIATNLARLKAATMSKLFHEGLRSEPLKETELGLIPESWDVVRLGDIAKIGNGSTPNRSDDRYWHQGVFPWITSTKVHDVFIKEAGELVSETALRECHLPVVPKGSLVIAITGQGKTLGNTALLDIETCVNQHLAYVRFQDQRPVPEFLLFWLQSQYDALRQVSSAGGSTKGALTCGYISDLKVPLPSSYEQKDITALLMDLTKAQHVAEQKARAVGDLFAALLNQLMTGTVRVRDRETPEVANA